ncbi:MAG TPA: hypothetical protein VGX48_26890 [Pyrinomonadaceae bacterium]|nr:hypothetical protein [Pyrinomonadaceae bacterium]
MAPLCFIGESVMRVGLDCLTTPYALDHLHPKVVDNFALLSLGCNAAIQWGEARANSLLQIVKCRTEVADAS